jgi:hypothetical protein
VRVAGRPADTTSSVSRPAFLHRLLLTLVLAAGVMPVLRAQFNHDPALRYQVSVVHEAGLTVVVFDTAHGTAALYLPDDLVEGEQVSGRIESVVVDGGANAFVLHADGLQATTSEKLFVWHVPKPNPDGVAWLTLHRRDGPDKTALARVELPVATRAPEWQPLLGHTAGEFVVAQVGQAGAAFPITGPFEGDARRTSFEVDGMRADVLAQSRRRLFVRLPGATTGRTGYRFRHGEVEQRGTIQTIKVDLTWSRTARRVADAERITVRVRGLQGWASPIMLTMENRTPARVHVSDGTGRAYSARWIPLYPRDIRNDGTWEWLGWLGIDSTSRQGLDPAVMVWIPKTADEQVLAVLAQRERDPLEQGRTDAPAALQPHVADALPALARILRNDYVMSWRALQTMLALDIDQAAEHVLSAIPSIMDRQAGTEALGVYTRRAVATPTASYRNTVHAAAVTVLTGPAPRGTDGSSCCDVRAAAIRTVGMLGSAADIPLLSTLRDVPLLQSAAEASLARLGSAPDIARIESVLEAPLPKRFTFEDAYRIIDAIKKAGFSGRREFIPLLCRHLDAYLPREARPTDVGFESPSFDAERAIAELSGQRFITDFEPYCPSQRRPRQQP